MGPDCVSGVMRSDREEHRDCGKGCQAKIDSLETIIRTDLKKVKI